MSYDHLKNMLKEYHRHLCSVVRSFVFVPFRKHITTLERRETKRYLEVLYILKMRELIKQV